MHLSLILLRYRGIQNLLSPHDACKECNTNGTAHAAHQPGPHLCGNVIILLGVYYDAKYLEGGCDYRESARRSPDVEQYTVRSNGRLGRLLLDAEMSAGGTSKADKASQAPAAQAHTSSRTDNDKDILFLI